MNNFEHESLAAKLPRETTVDRAGLPLQRGDCVPPFREPSVLLLPCCSLRGSLPLPPRILLLPRLLPTSDHLRTTFILHTLLFRTPLLLRTPLLFRTPLRLLPFFRLQALELLLETGNLLLEVVGVVARAVIKHGGRGKQMRGGAMECKQMRGGAMECKR